MKNTLPILALFLLLMLASCRITCSDPEIFLSVSQFDSSDITLVKLTEYEKYSNFSKLNRTIYGSSSIHGIDTILFNIPASYKNGFNLDINYDYVIEFIQSGIVYKVTGITVIPRKSYETDHDCTNAATWYVNGKKNESSRYLGNGSASILLSK